MFGVKNPIKNFKTIMALRDKRHSSLRTGDVEITLISAITFATLCSLYAAFAQP